MRKLETLGKSHDRTKEIEDKITWETVRVNRGIGNKSQI